MSLHYIIKHLRQAAVLTLLAMLASSCQWIVGDYDDEDAIDNDAARYINVTISVSANNSPATRAPQGGEYGDGTEMGIDERENKINFITLIFYQEVNDGVVNNNTGINTSSDNAKVVCVKKYAVHRFNADSDLPANYTHTHKETEPQPTTNPNEYYNQEILYTTGNQKLNENELTPGASYKVLVVANSDVYVKTGDKIKDIRDNVLSTVYTGTGIGTDAINFVMASETDATVTLDNPTRETTDGENKFIYYFNCIHIERLAARIDYWANNATFNDSDDDYSIEVGGPGNHTTTPVKGYLYKVGSTGHFMLTRILPFNVNMGTGNEYLFKRTNDATNPYLADETTTNWVVDPYTASKTTPENLGPGNAWTPPTWIMHPLINIFPAMRNAQTAATLPALSLSSETVQENKYPISTSDNIIIAYPKENTLNENSTLYHYATGLAFEGYYFKNGEKTKGERRVYYYYLRHQGEGNGTYMAQREFHEHDKQVKCDASTAMNYGIVRNNIYRVEISDINENGLHIKVKKWDPFTHEVIYM